MTAIERRKFDQATTWMEKAKDLLDQAHANMRDLGREQTRAGHRIDRRDPEPSLGELVNAVERLTHAFTEDALEYDR